MAKKVKSKEQKELEKKLEDAYRKGVRDTIGRCVEVVEKNVLRERELCAAVCREEADQLLRGQVHSDRVPKNKQFLLGAQHMASICWYLVKNRKSP